MEGTIAVRLMIGFGMLTTLSVFDFSFLFINRRRSNSMGFKVMRHPLNRMGLSEGVRNVVTFLKLLLKSDF